MGAAFRQPIGSLSVAYRFLSEFEPGLRVLLARSNCLAQSAFLLFVSVGLSVFIDFTFLNYAFVMSVSVCCFGRKDN
jgi:hypothetical protein